MPDLSFRIEGVEPISFAAAPALLFKLRIENADPIESIHTVALRCQIQLEVARRQYTPEEKKQLSDLFGEPSRWGQTLRTMHWTNTSLIVSAFQGYTIAGLQVACTFDFNVAATKFFHGLTDGEIPICLMFSGTAFYANEEGALQVAPIPWDKETRYRLPAKVWKDMMDLYYPNSAWINISRELFDKLHEYKMSNALPTWDQALEKLLDAKEVATL